MTNSPPTSYTKPGTTLPRGLEIGLLVVMVGAALFHLGHHLFASLTKQELDFIIIPVTGALFCLASACLLLSWRPGLLLLALSAAGGWLVEEVGVRTGVIFGVYEYGDALGPKLGSVPFVIPLFWFMMIYCGLVIANLIAEGVPQFAGRFGQSVWLSLLAGFVATAYDLGLDPYMSSPKIAAWTWLDGGAYFGVPPRNFLGWIGTVFVISLLFRLLNRHAGSGTPRPRRWVVLLPVIVYASFWLSLLAPSHPHGTRVVSLVALGIPTLAALATWSRWRVGDHGSAA